VVRSRRSGAPPLRTVSSLLPSADLPEPHPDPPADLFGRRLPLVEDSGPWIRGHPRIYDPLHFGKSGDGRFTAPAGEYGILYVASDEHAAFIETFGRWETTGRVPGWNVVSRVELAERHRALVTTSRPLRLVDLTGSGLTRIGADNRLSDGSYTTSRRWALAFHQHPGQPDGMRYRTRHDPSRFAAAIFDRAAPALRASRLGSLADPAHERLRVAILETYDFALLS
jgi:hypothetical protein